MGAPSAWSVSARVTVSSRPSPNDPPASVTATTRSPVAATVVSSSVAYTSTVSPGRRRPSTARSRPSVIDTSAAGSPPTWSLTAPELEQLPVADGRHEHPALEVGRRLERGPRHPGGQVDRHEADRVGGDGLAGGQVALGHRVGVVGRTGRLLPGDERADTGQRDEHAAHHGASAGDARDAGASPAPEADPAGPWARLPRQVASSPSHVVSPAPRRLPSALPSPPQPSTDGCGGAHTIRDGETSARSGPKSAQTPCEEVRCPT